MRIVSFSAFWNGSHILDSVSLNPPAESARRGDGVLHVRRPRPAHTVQFRTPSSASWRPQLRRGDVVTYIVERPSDASSWLASTNVRSMASSDEDCGIALGSSEVRTRRSVSISSATSVFIAASVKDASRVMACRSKVSRRERRAANRSGHSCRRTGMTAQQAACQREASATPSAQYGRSRAGSPRIRSTQRRSLDGPVFRRVPHAGSRQPGLDCIQSRRLHVKQELKGLVLLWAHLGYLAQRRVYVDHPEHDARHRTPGERMGRGRVQALRTVEEPGSSGQKVDRHCHRARW